MLTLPTCMKLMDKHSFPQQYVLPKFTRRNTFQTGKCFTQMSFLSIIHCNGSLGYAEVIDLHDTSYACDRISAYWPGPERKHLRIMFSQLVQVFSMHGLLCSFICLHVSEIHIDMICITTLPIARGAKCERAYIQCGIPLKYTKLYDWMLMVKLHCQLCIYDVQHKCWWNLQSSLILTMHCRLSTVS